MQIGRYLILIPLTFGLVVSIVDARPRFLRGSVSSGGSAPAQACDGGSSVCAQFQDGQTFVTWDDVGTTGAEGASTRYRVYRSTSPINSGNYSSATLIAKYVFNNSAQLFGGDPDDGVGSWFTAANRQDAALPMSKITDLGTAQEPLTGLQVHTALATENAYYAVVSTDTNDASPSYIGSVGPIGESVATPRPVLYAASGSRADNSYGTIGDPTGLPVVFVAHGSAQNGGPPPYSYYGDYWQWWFPVDSGWQDGRSTTLAVFRDNAGHSPSLPSSIEIYNRDTIWSPDGTSAIETIHQGVGMSPLNGPADRWYPITARGISRMLLWSIDHYNLDANRVHWTGTSMGAHGGANTGMLSTNPRFAALWLNMPNWRLDLQLSSGWPGYNWDPSYPFKATLGTCPACLGDVASDVLTDTGEVWGGTSGIRNIPAFIEANPGNDLPPTHYHNTKDDGSSNWITQIQASDAFQTARRNYVFAWSMGGHGSTDPGSFNCNADNAIVSVCYGMNLYALNVPYIAFSNSSIDDDPGTGARDGNGITDGDYSGCINCGHKWNVTTDNASAFNFTVDNEWMHRDPTEHPPTTIAEAITSPSYTGVLALTDNSGFLSTFNYNQYFLIGGVEFVWGGESTPGSNTMTVWARGQLGTTAQTHSSGATIVQMASLAIGPNGGPYSSMTVDITPRRIQGFAKGTTNGQVITCDITPNGGATTQQTPTVTNNIFTLTNVTINASGATSIQCS